ncbi:MAG TPA: hypothetical protein VIZ43_15710 [Trebonia sp.]
MPEKAVISHRGEKYEIGRGKRFYGIWVVGAPYDAPVDRWPENRDGWQQAWARFASIEVPGTISPVTSARRGLPFGIGRRKAEAVESADGAASAGAAVSRPRAGSGLLVGELLLVLGVVLGLAGLFPDYDGGQSLLSQWSEVVPHLCYVIGWAVTAAFVALSVARPSGAARVGALFGLGLSAVTFGLFLSDLGQVTAGATLGSGLIVSLVSWGACTAGSALAFAATARSAGPRALPSRPVRPNRWHAGPLALLVLAGIGTAVSFAPSWDSYVLTVRATNTAQTVTAGNAFDSPGVVIAGNVAFMVAIIAVTVLAALWRPPRHGAVLLAGALVPVAAQIVSALIQVAQPASPSLFGISSAEASAAGLTISSGLTGIFWVYFVFAIALAVSCAWLFTEPGHPVMTGFAASPWQPAGTDPTAPGTPAAGATVSEDADSDASEDTDSGEADSDSPAADSDSASGDGEQSAYA